MHKTIFPSDFLSDFGFLTVRMSGRVELARLELGGLQPVLEGTREKVLRVVRDAFVRRPRPSGPSVYGCNQVAFGNLVAMFVYATTVARSSSAI